jgi:hypothetical protein
MSCESLDAHDASKKSRERFKFVRLFVSHYSMNPHDEKKKNKTKMEGKEKE